MPTSRWPQPTTPAYEPVATSPTSVRVYDETGTRYRHTSASVSFPATKQDLLRLARANNDEPGVLRKLEQVADRSYSNLHDLMSALSAA